MFTQKQLESAFKQMESERNQEAEVAASVASWLEEKTELNFRHKLSSSYGYEIPPQITPHQHVYELFVVSDTGQVVERLESLGLRNFYTKNGELTVDFDIVKFCNQLRKVKQRIYEIRISE